MRTARMRGPSPARALVALVAALSSAPPAAAQDPTLAAFERIRDEQRVPALAGLLLRDGAVVERVAVGVRKAGEPTPVDRDDAFHLGSDTKAMTATVVARLIERGALSWTATLGDLLPDLPAMDPAFRAVTIEMLLAHRGGLGSEGDFDGGRLFAGLRAPGLSVVEGRRRVAAAMLSRPPATTPGEFAYSNAGYLVVGHVIERLTGRSWETLTRELLFEPLGMTGCGFGALGDADATVAGQPWGHRSTVAGLVPVVLDNPATLGPAGTIHCPMADWATFIALHMDAFNGRPRLLGAASFDKLHTAPDGQSYTVGGWLRTERNRARGPVFTHDGSNTLNYATVWWAPAQNVAVLAVTNAGPPAGQVAAQQALVWLLERANAR